LYALSQLSGYRLADWLRVFGFCLDDVPRLQAVLDRPRTTLLDGTVYDARAMIPWLRERSPEGSLSRVAPLSQLLEPLGSRRLLSLVSVDPYLYAKIGRQDAFAFPNLTPGSIVRANPRLSEQLSRKSTGEISKDTFLVEHSRGLCCCRLHFGAKNRVTLMATQLPFANVELQLEAEARILGVVDMELRPLAGYRRLQQSPCTPPEVAPDLARLWTPGPLKQELGAPRPAVLLRSARLRAGLSLRHASEISRAVAIALDDKRYFASPGSLSEYEARDTPPRPIHKLLTICVLYSIRFRELLNSFGLETDESHMASIPDEWMTPGDGPIAESPVTTTRGRRTAGGFLTTLVGQFGEIPFFLRQSLACLSGLPQISLRDVFWVGGPRRAMHPSLAGALFVIVDRRKRRPRIFRRKTPWEQPVYLLMRRDGSYLLASCSLEDGALAVHPYTEGFVRPERLRDRVDAEVVGQIVTIIRSLPSPP
jgi:hypothetical protein